MYFGKHFLCVVRLLSRTLPLCGLCTCKNTTSANVFKIHYLCFAHIISKQLHLCCACAFRSPLYLSVVHMCTFKNTTCVVLVLSKTYLYIVRVLSKTISLRWACTFKDTTFVFCPRTFKNTSSALGRYFQNTTTPLSMYFQKHSVRAETSTSPDLAPHR